MAAQESTAALKVPAVIPGWLATVGGHWLHTVWDVIRLAAAVQIKPACSVWKGSSTFIDKRLSTFSISPYHECRIVAAVYKAVRDRFDCYRNHSQHKGVLAVTKLDQGRNAFKENRNIGGIAII